MDNQFNALMQRAFGDNTDMECYQKGETDRQKAGVSPKKIKLFEQVLRDESLIKKIFGDQWIKKSIIEHYNDKSSIHPVFGTIIYDEYFVKKLDVLKKSNVFSLSS